MGSPVAAMLGNSAIGQCGPQNNDPILREQLGCPPLEPTEPVVPTPGDPYAGATPEAPLLREQGAVLGGLVGLPMGGTPAAPPNISQYEVPGPTQVKMGIPGAQLNPQEQLQAALGQGAQRYNQMMGPPAQGGLPGYEASQPGMVPPQGQNQVMDMLMRMFGR